MESFIQKLSSTKIIADLVFADLIHIDVWQRIFTWFKSKSACDNEHLQLGTENRILKLWAIPENDSWKSLFILCIFPRKESRYILMKYFYKIYTFDLQFYLLKCFPFILHSIKGLFSNFYLFYKIFFFLCQKRFYWS